MKIAQVAPLYESVPPKYYGGTERVVSYLTEELLRQGHQVTLFASGDSVTQADLVAPWPHALRLDDQCVDQLAPHMVLLQQVFQQEQEAHPFDLIHFHIDYLHYPLTMHLHTPHVTTLHGRLDIPELVPLYQTFSTIPVVSISASQRAPLPWLGRISPEKGVEQAIAIAQRAGMPLKIAAKVGEADRDYFHEVVQPLLDSPLVQCVGEVREGQKDDFLGQ